ncbi:hybrid sensor histidine kinase/response regulator transcription factor [Polaribacter sp. Hel_I_88]|uniref:hybrid sensor histidine kinase/response regulator transcription factor n=1 Tax=Polaribacter sp. Hel_I_88 TaxID=1250006 RepID=UPI00047E32B4|nr:hybrid sensor histidine kinase/response regulator transcription factor [Polaribacter sp. Hel_I_88]
MRKIFITLLFLFFSFLSFGKQEQDINFKNIDNKQGLSQNGVTCIFQDKDGYMWFGTHYGLNRYNGLNIETYYGGDSKKELGSNTINAITQDTSGNIWIATHQGISVFNPITEKFFNLGKYEAKKGIFNQNILSMNLIDKKIILTSSEGIWRINPGNELFTEEIARSISKNIDDFNVKLAFNYGSLRVFEKDNNDSYWLTTDNKVLDAKIINNELIILDTITIEKSKKVTITAFLKDNFSNIWVGTSSNGLYHIREEKGKYITIKIYPKKNSSNKFSRITNIIKDYENNILVTSRSDGTIIISEDEIKKKDLSQIKINSLELYTQKIKSIYQSRDKTLWIGSLGNGVYFQNKSGLKFKNYQIKDKINSPVVNNTRSITKDSFGRLWLGSLFEGLYIYDATNTKVEKLLLNDKSIFSLCKIDDTHILVGSSDGLYLINYDKTNFVAKKLLTNNNIESVIFSITHSENQYWVASERGLMSFTLTENYQISNLIDYESEIPLNISSLKAMRVVNYDPHHNILWIGSQSNGLIKAVLNEDYTIKDFYAINSSSDKSQANEYICDILIENKNQIWIGSRNGLIDLKLSNTGDITNIKKFTIEDGFPSNLVQSVKSDLSGNLWIGTNKGLVKFNKQTNDIITYDINDGVQGLEFSEHASYKDFDNFLYFGGTNGVSKFSPDFSVSEGFSEGVDIKDIIINGININERRYFKDSTNAITLSHFENNVKFNFISPNFINPKKQKYLYQLKGFDKDWKSTKNYVAEYSNLPKGNYVFEVKSIYENGTSSDQISTIEIKIEPSIWLTLPAYILYVIVVIAFIYVISTITKKRLERKNKELLKNRYHEQMEKVNKSKIEFFINISHEIRTPLTLILCSIEKLLSNFKLNQKQENEALTIDRNVHRILELTNELLSIRKMETGNYNLRVQYDDIMLFLQNTKVSFDGLAKKKGIKLSIKTYTSELFMWFDKNALEKIIYNLISNAIKYTNEKGSIEIKVKLSKNKQFLNVKVIDTGIGIDKKHVSKIFNRFYNQGGNIDRYVSGFGIGLSLTKSLVDLHKGNISVTSELHKGSVFTLSLPLDDSLFSEEEKVDRMLWETSLPTVLNTDDNDDKEEIPSLEPEKNKKEQSKSTKPTLLYIDDNTELLMSISDYFSDHYQIFTAENGVSGLKIANDLQPDIIISDIVMPEMDGLELCKTLKNDINTSHIPVILLTAMGDIDSQLHGVESGADYYIPKPFNIKLLSLTVKNLIESRNKLKNLFLTNEYSDSKDITTNTKDQEFIDNLLSYVNEHIEDDNLNINTIADAFAMSRSTFFRKIKVITGTTGKQFIDSVRLKKATQLLTQSDLNISEIGYAVGHSNPQYFSKWFKSYYKVSPTEYKSQHKKVE